MANNLTLRMVADNDIISVRAGLTEEQFEQFKEDPYDFDDRRIYFVENGNFRNIEIEYEDGDITELDKKIFDNSIDPEDKGSDDPVLKKMCEDLAQQVEDQYWLAKIKKLAPNTVTIIEKWHAYKGMESFDIELEDDEEFDQDKFKFVRDSYKPQWLLEYERKTQECPLEDVFVGNRVMAMTIVYDGQIIDNTDDEDCGADLVVRYAVRTDESGNVVSIDELDFD